MICLGNQVRLAAKDRERLRLLCGRDPGALCTVAEYNAFIEAQLAVLPDNTAERRLVRWLLQELRVADAAGRGRTIDPRNPNA